MGHLQSVGVCLDLGHAHISSGVSDAVTALGKRIVSVHVHDNHGIKDEHLWPGEGTIDWPAAAKVLTGLAEPPATVLEVATIPGDLPADFYSRVEQTFSKLA
jgi:sugar phosphate isomerase/epimerase